MAREAYLTRKAQDLLDIIVGPGESIVKVAVKLDFTKRTEASTDPTKQVATSYGVLNPRGTALRWTFYIGTDGRILAIDKAVRPPTSAEDMVAKLGELNVAKTKSN